MQIVSYSENNVWHFMQIVSFNMKCQIQFSGKNKKNIINVSSTESAQPVIKTVPFCLAQPNFS